MGFNNGIIVLGGGKSANGGSTIGLKDITWTALKAQIDAQTAKVGFYNVTGRPNSGTDKLTVEVLTNGKAVAADAIIQRFTRAVISIQVGDNTGNAGAFYLTVNGNRISDDTFFDGSLQTPADIAAAIGGSISDANYTAFVINDTAYICSLPENGLATNTALLSFFNISGDTPACTYSNFTGGGVFDHAANYDFLNDIIYYETDTIGNKFTYNAVAFFPCDNNGIAYGCTFIGCTYDFSSFAGTLYNVTVNPGSQLTCFNSNVALKNINVIDSPVDFSYFIAGESFSNLNISVNQNPFQPLPQDNLIVNRETSNYRATFNLNSNQVSYADSVNNSCAGEIVVYGTGTLNKIAKSDSAPRFVTVSAYAGTTITIASASAINLVLVNGTASVVITGKSSITFEKMDDGAGDFIFYQRSISII